MYSLSVFGDLVRFHVETKVRALILITCSSCGSCSIAASSLLSFGLFAKIIREYSNGDIIFVNDQVGYFLSRFFTSTSSFTLAQKELQYLTLCHLTYCQELLIPSPNHTPQFTMTIKTATTFCV